MKFNEAFDQALKDCRISARWLSEEAGISTTAISEFRRGRKSLTADNLERLLDALPEEVLDVFYELKRDGVRRRGNIQEQLDGMSAEELSQLIVAIAARIPRVARRELQKV